MRGRTNAEPNIGVQLNASVDTYEVATGETILAGDFVEQYIEEEGQLDDLSVTTNEFSFFSEPHNVYKASNGKYICRNKILDRTGDVFSLDSSSNTYFPYYNCIDLGNNTCIGIDTEKLSNGVRVKAHIAKYDTTNNTIDAKDIYSDAFYSLSTSYTNEVSASKFVETSTSGKYKGAFVHGAYLSSSNKWTVYVVTFDLQITGSNYDNYELYVNNKVVKTYSSQTLSSPTFVLDFIARISSTEDYLIGFNYLTTRKYIQLNNGTFGNDINRIASCYIPMNSIAEDGNIDFFYHVSEGSGATIKQYSTHKRVYFPAGNWNYNEYTEDRLYDNDVYNGGFTGKYLGTKNNLAIYILYYSKEDNVSQPFILVVSINTLNGEVTVGERLNILPAEYCDSASLYSSEFENNEIILILGHYYSTGYTPLFLMEYVNGSLESKDATVKKVKGITTQKYIKGVAKQSGTAGDTIQVYVPTVNS